MCGDGKKTELGYPLFCWTCRTQLMRNTCMYYPYYCPKCDDTMETGYDPDEDSDT